MRESSVKDAVTASPALIHSSKSTLTIVALELVVGAIATFGGIALTYFATVKALGIIHTGLGLAAFPVAYGLWRKGSWTWTAAVGLNLATIAYETLAEAIASSGGLLGADQLQDSIIGTIIAIIFGLLTLVLLAYRRKQ